MKSSQRLEYARLADALSERKLVERAALDHVLQQCAATSALMSDILVREHLISDWELSRVVCELYGLPFLPVDNYPPRDGALDGLDADYLRQYGLVPFDRFGKLLTVSMPALVPTEVLDGLVRGDEVRVLPAVGTVGSNRRWLDEHLPAPQMPALDLVAGSLPSGEGGAAADWANIFDAADEAVQDELRRQQAD